MATSLVRPTLISAVIWRSVICLLAFTTLRRRRRSRSLSAGGRPLRCPWWDVMPEIRYSRHTLDTVDLGMLNYLTMSEMAWSMRLAPTKIPRSKSVNSRRGVIITFKPLHVNNFNTNESPAKALSIYTYSTRCYCHLYICILLSHDFCHLSVYIWLVFFKLMRYLK